MTLIMIVWKWLNMIMNIYTLPGNVVTFHVYVVICIALILITGNNYVT